MGTIQALDHNGLIINSSTREDGDPSDESLRGKDDLNVNPVYLASGQEADFVEGIHFDSSTMSRSRQVKFRYYSLLLTRIIGNKMDVILKRGFDILLASLVFPFIAPLMLLTAIAIRLESPGPIIFKQERVGKNGKRFMCYKFRSMYQDAEARKAELMAHNEADEIVFKMKRDPRITRVGRIIRKLSLDELPQFFNVLKGDMSVVGPRPPVPIEVQNYKYEYFRRLEAVPGITGLQQVSGRSELNFKQWIALDVQYIQENSFMKDVEILAKTIPAVITGRGAY